MLAGLLWLASCSSSPKSRDYTGYMTRPYTCLLYTSPPLPSNCPPGQDQTFPQRRADRTALLPRARILPRLPAASWVCAERNGCRAGPEHPPEPVSYTHLVHHAYFHLVQYGEDGHRAFRQCQHSGEAGIQGTGQGIRNGRPETPFSQMIIKFKTCLLYTSRCV